MLCLLIQFQGKRERNEWLITLDDDNMSKRTQPSNIFYNSWSRATLRTGGRISFDIPAPQFASSWEYCAWATSFSLKSN